MRCYQEEPLPDNEDVCLIRGDQGRAIRALLDRIADKWALLIIATLHTQRLRFTSLQRRIPGISQRMLSLTLRKLERDGLVIPRRTPRCRREWNTSSANSPAR